MPEDRGVEACHRRRRKDGVGDGQVGNIIGGERDPAKLLRLLADKARNPDVESV